MNECMNTSVKNNKRKRRNAGEALRQNNEKKTGSTRHAKVSTLSALKHKLQGSKFRWLNEVMYTRSGEDSLAMIKETPQLYDEYHQGYREQTKHWPERPVDRAVAWLSARPKEWHVVDLGCGDAELSKRIPQRRVENFDLAPGPHVTVCNIASLPLKSASVDVAVFCLSLMGIDYGSFIEEAARVLKLKGWLWIAEVQSRCIDDKGKSMLDKLISSIETLGFVLKSKSIENSHFFSIVFQKQKQPNRKQEKITFPALRACVYKKR